MMKRWFRWLPPVAAGSVLLAACSSGAAPKTSSATASSLPSGPITLIVPFKAGGSVNVLAHVLASQLHKQIGRPVEVVNVPGGSTATAFARVEASPANGRTLFFEDVGYLSAIVAKHEVPYSIKDLTPVVLVGGEATGLFAAAHSPFKTLKQVVSYAKAHPGKLTIVGTGAIGAIEAVAKKFAQEAGIKITYVPTEGGGTTVSDVVGGHADLGLVTPSVYLPLQKAGKVRSIAVSSRGAYPYLPGVPTFTQSGYPLSFYNFIGVMVKRGTPKATVDALAAAIKKVTSTSTWQSYMHRDDEVSHVLGPTRFAQYVQRDYQKYVQLYG